LPDTGPPSTAGFVFLDGLFSVAGAVPANLSFGRDLTIRRKIENGWYYCALGLRSPSSNQGTERNPRGPERAIRDHQAAAYVAAAEKRWACHAAAGKPARST
jgi:hypothetical protein